jgi:small GTP-binding protein
MAQALLEAGRLGPRKLVVVGWRVVIDTAGVRRRGRVEPGVEKHSVLRTMRAIERSDVALLLIDAEEGVTAQDTHIAGMILDQLKGVAILVNKWDLVIKDDETFYAFTRTVREAFKFIPYAPLIFISAKTGQRVDQVLPTALAIADERRKRVPTSQLNALLRQALFEHPPSSIKVGAHLRIYYATQPQVNPPVFLFFANDSKMIHWGYARYLENRLREKFGYVGTPTSNAVLPIDGRAATMIKSDRWKPSVILSRSGRWVPTPVMYDWCSNSFSILGKLSCTSVRIGTKPALTRSSATEKIAPSASSRIRSASWSAS